MSQLRNNCGDCDRSDAALINGFSRKHSLIAYSTGLSIVKRVKAVYCEGNAEIAPSLFQERQILPVSLTKSHLDRSSVKQEQKYLQLF